jgi:dynein heavy chain
MSKSSAAAGLCSWVININRFYEVYIEDSKAELQAAQDKKKLLEERLNVLENELSKLEAENEAALNEKLKIDLSQRLVGGLASENVRWREKVTMYQASRVTLPGDVLLVSCFISYVGCFSRSYRIELMHSC